MRRGKFELEILKLIIMKRLTLLNCQLKFTWMKFLKIPIKQTATNYSILSWKRMQYIISSSRSLPPQFVNIHVKKILHVDTTQFISVSEGVEGKALIDLSLPIREADCKNGVSLRKYKLAKSVCCSIYQPVETKWTDKLKWIIDKKWTDSKTIITERHSYQSVTLRWTAIDICHKLIDQTH